MPSVMAGKAADKVNWEISKAGRTAGRAANEVGKFAEKAGKETGKLAENILRTLSGKELRVYKKGAFLIAPFARC